MTRLLPSLNLTYATLEWLLPPRTYFPGRRARYATLERAPSLLPRIPSWRGAELKEATAKTKGTIEAAHQKHRKKPDKAAAQTTTKKPTWKNHQDLKRSHGNYTSRKKRKTNKGETKAKDQEGRIVNSNKGSLGQRPGRREAFCSRSRALSTGTRVLSSLQEFKTGATGW